MTEEIRLGKHEAKFTAMPPPREYPKMEKELGPVHEREEEASTKKMVAMKNSEVWAWTVGDGVDE